MPNDAKLGLVAGVGIVLAVAVTCFRKDLMAGRLPADERRGAVANVRTPPQATPSHETRTAPRPSGHSASSARRHTVREGETLFGLAQRYYGDGSKSEMIFQTNRQVLKSPETLIPGTVLIIPDVRTMDHLGPADEPEQGSDQS